MMPSACNACGRPPGQVHGCAAHPAAFPSGAERELLEEVAEAAIAWFASRRYADLRLGRAVDALQSHRKRVT